VATAAYRLISQSLGVFLELLAAINLRRKSNVLEHYFLAYFSKSAVSFFLFMPCRSAIVDLPPLAK